MSLFDIRVREVKITMSPSSRFVYLQPHIYNPTRSWMKEIFTEANVFIEIMDRRSKAKIFDSMLEEIQMLLGFFELVNFY